METRNSTLREDRQGKDSTGRNKEKTSTGKSKEKTGKEKGVSLGGTTAKVGTMREQTLQQHRLPTAFMGKASARSNFSPHFVFPRKTQTIFKVALSPDSSRGSHSFLHLESPLSKETKTSLKKIFVAQITIFFCEFQNLPH